MVGQVGSQQTLTLLERGNLFVVPLDGERHWYRYHRLFADLLRQRAAVQAGLVGLLVIASFFIVVARPPADRSEGYVWAIYQSFDIFSAVSRSRGNTHSTIT